MEGPKRLQLNQLGKPAKGQPLAELRFVNESGDTEVWLIAVEQLDFEGLSSPQRVRMAYLDKGIDSRLGNQKASIERLLRHVNAHHDDILTEAHKRGTDWACDWTDDGGPADRD